MAEMALAGVPPHLFWDYTWREVHAVMAGAALGSRRAFKLTLWGAWHGEVFARSKRLGDLNAMLRKLDPARIMSAQALRQAILGIAEAMGAEVVRRAKKE